jgi:valyl-tRNA synthetase
LDQLLVDEAAEKTMRGLQGVIEGIRTFRGENNVSPKVEFEVGFSTSDEQAAALLLRHRAELLQLARVQGLARVSGAGSDLEAVLPLAEPRVELRIGLKGLVNVEEETRRLQKEIEKVKADIEFVAASWAGASVSKAPPELVEKERQKERELEARLAELNSGIERLRKLGS